MYEHICAKTNLYPGLDQDRCSCRGADVDGRRRSNSRGQTASVMTSTRRTTTPLRALAAPLPLRNRSVSFALLGADRPASSQQAQWWSQRRSLRLLPLTNTSGAWCSTTAMSRLSWRLIPNVHLTDQLDSKHTASRQQIVKRFRALQLWIVLKKKFHLFSRKARKQNKAIKSAKSLYFVLICFNHELLFSNILTKQIVSPPDL